MDIDKRIDDQLLEAWTYINSSPHKALKLAKLIKDEATTLNLTNEIAISQIVEAHALWRMSQYEGAMQLLDTARSTILQHPPSMWHFRMYSAYHNIYHNLGIFDEAFRYLYLMGDVANALDDEKRRMQVEGNLGALHANMGEHERAIEHFKIILDYAQRTTKRDWEFITYCNLATSYMKRNQLEQAGDMVYYAQEVMDRSVAEEQYSVHQLFAEIYIKQGAYEPALPHLEQITKLVPMIDIKRLTIESFVTWGQYYSHQDKHEEAINSLTQALQLAIEIEDLNQQLTIHEQLYTLYQQQQNWEQALQHHIQIRTIENTLFNQASDERIHNLEIVYRIDQLQQTYQRQEQEYETIIEIKDRLLSTLSHDLKNPLSVIRNLVHIATRKAELVNQENPYQQYFDRIDHQVERMAELITDILDIAQLDLSIELSHERVYLPDLIDKTQQDLSPQAQSKEMTIDASHNMPKGVKISVNRQWMKRVFDNLLNNAIKYSPPSSRIAIETKATHDNIIISIVDNGYGIPSDELPKIFDRFFRGRAKDGPEEGTGLGLAIVKTIIEQHNGTIDVDSVLDKGTTFTITLPLDTIKSSHK